MRNCEEAQKAVDALRRDLTGTCWWCGGVADSREHKFKKSDLHRLANGDSLYWGSEGTGKELQGYKRSNITRFGKVLCRRCNNVVSQPFDCAYDRYSRFVSGHSNSLWPRSGIRFDELYGAATWEVDTRNLARYFAKNFGCLMADNGLEPPQVLRDFMDGADECLDTGMFLVKDQARWMLHKELLRHEPRPEAGLWIEPGYGMVARDGSRLHSYHATTFVGYIGVQFVWQDGSGHRDSFYLHSHPVLNRRRAHRQIKRMMRAARQRSNKETAD